MVLFEEGVYPGVMSKGVILYSVAERGMFKGSLLSVFFYGCYSSMFQDIGRDQF